MTMTTSNGRELHNGSRPFIFVLLALLLIQGSTAKHEPLPTSNHTHTPWNNHTGNWTGWNNSSGNQTPTPTVILSNENVMVVNQGNFTIITYTDGTSFTVPYTGGDPDNGGPGLLVSNFDTVQDSFFLYGAVPPAYESDMIPYEYMHVDAGATIYVSVPLLWSGRIVRGLDSVNLDGNSHNLGTWVEYHIDNTSQIWGDVSLIAGNDGAAFLAGTDNQGQSGGFTQDLLANAPADALEAKSDGTLVLAPTVGGTSPDTSTAALNYYISIPGLQESTYCSNNPAYAPSINSLNGRFQVNFYPGRL